MHSWRWGESNPRLLDPLALELQPSTRLSVLSLGGLSLPVSVLSRRPFVFPNRQQIG